MVLFPAVVELLISINHLNTTRTCVKICKVQSFLIGRLNKITSKTVNGESGNPPNGLKMPVTGRSGYN